MSRYLRPAVLLAVLFAIPLTMWPATADAQGRRHARRPAVIVGGYYGSFVYDPFFYDPFFGPYGWGPYGYPYYTVEAEVRVLVTPKDAEVYVDGYYAGTVDNFDSFFQRLSVRPGGHEFVLYREGYRAIHQTVYVQPRSTLSLRHTMVPLAAGEAMEPRPVPVPAPPSGTPGGTPPTRRTPGPPPQPGPAAGPESPGY
jgi:hypothetical protein